MSQEIAVIVGAGAGLSAAVARLCKAQGMQVALAARNVDKLAELATETAARCYACDVTQASEVEALFSAIDEDLGCPDLVLFNPSARVRGGIAELDPEAVQKALSITCFGGFLVGQAAAKRMLARGNGSILFTGASASVKGYVNSATFAMGKFGLRGLAQSMARELAPKNIHVGHFVIDGGILGPKHAAGGEDALLKPEAIAESYLHVHRQDRSAWTWEVELRPWVENF